MSEGLCPLCGQPVYGWIKLPPAGDPGSVGVPARRDGDPRVVDRCENCGAAFEHGSEVDLRSELEAVSSPAPSGELVVEAPNRASLQAALSAGGWSALELVGGKLILTPAALRLLVEQNGYRLGAVAFPVVGPNQGWMWQTLVNGLTIHANFARNVRAGTLRASNARSRIAFAADLVATALAAPLVALVSFPAEALAALFKRGGLIRATATPEG